MSRAFSQFTTTRAEHAFEPHHYSDSFLLNMKWIFAVILFISLKPPFNRARDGSSLAHLWEVLQVLCVSLCVSLRVSYLKGRKGRTVVQSSCPDSSKGMPKFYLTSELTKVTAQIGTKRPAKRSLYDVTRKHDDFIKWDHQNANFQVYDITFWTKTHFSCNLILDGWKMLQYKLSKVC